MKGKDSWRCGACKSGKEDIDTAGKSSQRGNTITEQNVDYALSLVLEDQEAGIMGVDKDIIIIHFRKTNQTEDTRTEKICRCNS